MIQKRKITLPDDSGTVSYKERLILSIVAKVLGASTVLISKDTIHIECTDSQERQIQALISKCLPELDYIIEQAVLSHLHSYDLCTDTPVELKLKYA